MTKTKKRKKRKRKSGHVTFEKSVKMEGLGIYAESSFDDTSAMTYDDQSNKAAESCFIRVVDLLHETFEKEQTILYTESSLITSDTSSKDYSTIFDLQCIDGAVGCNGECARKTNLGSYGGCGRNTANFNLFSALPLNNNLDLLILIIAIIAVLKLEKCWNLVKQVDIRQSKNSGSQARKKRKKMEKKC